MRAFAVLVLAVSLPAARVDGAGPRATDTRTPFAAGTAPSSLRVKGALQVTVTEGAPQVTVTAEKNLLAMVTVEVVGGVLEVKTVGEPVSDKGVVVAVRLPALSTLKLHGSVRFSGVLQGEAVVDVGGASELKLTGAPKNLTMTAKGASSIHAGALKTNAVKLTVGGAANVDLGPCESLTITGNGVGQIRYRGDPKITSKASGTVKVSKAGT